MRKQLVEEVVRPPELRRKSSEQCERDQQRREIIPKAKGEANEVRATPGWEGVRVQIDSGAIDTAGLQEIAKVFEMKETARSKRGI